MRIKNIGERMIALTCDLETTGTNPHLYDWIEGSFGLMDIDSGEVFKEFTINSRPNSWTNEAYKIHLISKNRAIDFQCREDALEELFENLPDEELWFMCHAHPKSELGFFHFDFAFLKMDALFCEKLYRFRQYFSDKRVISTSTMAKERGFSGKLKNLCGEFGIELNHHNAESDRQAMEEIYRRLTNEGREANGSRHSSVDPRVAEIQGSLRLEE